MGKRANMSLLYKLRMSKHRGKKVMITDIAIEKVPRIEYECIPESEYNTIQNLTKQVLRIAKNKNNSNEVAITYRLETNTSNANNVGIALGGRHTVEPLHDSTSYHLIMTTRESSIVLIHNHPSLTLFSMADIQFLVQHESIIMITAVTNLGHISYLVKSKNYSYCKSVALLNAAIKIKNKAKNFIELEDASNFFLKNSKKIGIYYQR